VYRDTFKTRATSVWVMLPVVTMCCAIRTCFGVNSRGRPEKRPRARAVAKPA
jgi:hypothetical protein